MSASHPTGAGDDTLEAEIVEATRLARAASRALTQAADADDADGIEQAVTLRGEALAKLRAALARVPHSERAELSRRIEELMALDADDARSALERARRRASDGLQSIGTKVRGVRGYTPPGAGSPSSLDRSG